MKKHLSLVLLLIAVLCLSLLSCDKECQHTFDENGICESCGYEKQNTACTVTFDTDGGSKIESQQVKKGEKASKPADPEKQGYAFDGWYYDDEKWSFVGYTVTEDMTLTAKWVPITYEVKFVDQDGNLISTQRILSGEKLTKPEDPGKENYIFDGWYYDDEKWSFVGYTVTEDMTLTAKWTPITYTVRFVDENNNLITVQTVIKGSKLVKPTDPEKDGCTFVGWFDIGVVWDFNSNTVKQNLTLKTKWVAYVAYNLDGGTNSSENPITIYSDSTLPIRLQNPTKNGYKFEGWYADAQFTVRVENITSCSHHILYALWLEYAIDEPEHENPKYPWKTTNLIFNINENSDSQQLPSSSRRYLAGDLRCVDGGGDKIDQYVADRNSDALKETNVTVEYRYLPDTDVYGWSQSITYINAQVTSGDVETPDVFVNFVYDMVACSLLGNFANLRSTTMYQDGHELAGYNGFSFTKDENLNEFGEYEDTGKGYMYEYMRSLTLSKYMMYCLSSDYFIDMVRASTVIPVNIELLETYITATSEQGKWNSDRIDTFDENGNLETNYTIEDLYELVYAGEWNYDALAKFSEAVTGGTGDANSITAERLGFALGTDTGLPASGMLYTTPIVIVEREYNGNTREYTYSYPNMKRVTDANGRVSHVIDVESEDATFEQLVDFCTKLSNLMGTNGIVTTSETKDGVHSTTSIRDAFVSNRLLFGGVIVLGGLEHSDYAAMNGEGKSGYGIVPVPLYNETLGAEDYRTHLHNNAKIGAIAFSTKKFAQCSAYLDYQSTHSYEILTQYYNYTLSNLVEEGGVGGNTDMLRFIRDNIRSNFDSTYEDALGEFYKGQTGGTSDEQKWHNIIKAADFNVTDMRGQYATVAAAKADRLYVLENIVFPSLPC